MGSHSTLGEILIRSSILGEFVKKSEQLIQLNRSVLQLFQQVEPSLAPHCTVHSFNKNILILSSPSSMWGHKLRFKVPELIEHLRQIPRFSALKSIQIKIKPELEQETRNKKLETRQGTKIEQETRNKQLETRQGTKIEQETRNKQLETGLNELTDLNKLMAISPKKLSFKAITLSSKSARVIHDMAQEISSPKLQAALLRLCEQETRD